MGRDWERAPTSADQSEQFAARQLQRHRQRQSVYRLRRHAESAILTMNGLIRGLTAGAWLASACVAKIEGNRFIQHRFTYRPDGIAFSQEKIKSPNESPSITRYEFDGFHWETIEEQLTHADQLNGITWKGKIGVKFAASRTSLTDRYSNAGPCWKPWQDVPKWTDGPPYDFTWSLQHINGNWHTSREDSKHWFSWAFGGEDATTLNEQEVSQALSFAPCG
jgi:hypothetical protein